MPDMRRNVKKEQNLNRRSEEESGRVNLKMEGYQKWLKMTTAEMIEAIKEYQY